MVHVSCFCYHFTSFYPVEVVLGPFWAFLWPGLWALPGWNWFLIVWLWAVDGGGSWPCGVGRLELHIGYEEAYGIAGSIVYLYRVEVHKGVRL